MDREMTGNKKDTIEEQSNRVMNIARDLARDINNFLIPNPNKDGDSPTPVINALDQIAENLKQTEIALKAANAAFNKLKERIR